MPLPRALLLVAPLALACSSAPAPMLDSGLRLDAGPLDADVACPNVAGLWRFEYTCGTGAGSFVGTVTQSACTATLVQMDDRTPMTWTSSGELGTAGEITLSGELGFSTATMCTGTASADAWSLSCGPCTVTAAPAP